MSQSSLNEKSLMRSERGCYLSEKQYNLILGFLAYGHFPSRKELIDAHFVPDGEDQSTTRPHRRFKAWAQRLMYRQTEHCLIHLPTGKVVIPHEKFVQVITETHCGKGDGGHFNANVTVSKIFSKYTSGKRNFGMSEELIRKIVNSCGVCYKKITKKKRSSLQEDADFAPASTTLSSGIYPKSKRPCTEKDKIANKRQLKENRNDQNLEETCSASGSNPTNMTESFNNVDIKKSSVGNEIQNSHPIIHNTLKSSNFPLLFPVTLPMLPILSPATFVSQASFGVVTDNKTKTNAITGQIPFPLVSSKSIRNMVPAVGYYVKVSNSASPTGFMLSFVPAPAVSLSSSTICSPSTASVPVSMVTSSSSTASVPVSMVTKQGMLICPLPSVTSAVNTSAPSTQGSQIQLPSTQILSNQSTILIPPLTIPLPESSQKSELAKALQEPSTIKTLNCSAGTIYTPPKRGEQPKSLSLGTKRKLHLKLKNSQKGNKKNGKTVTLLKTTSAHRGKTLKIKKNSTPNQDTHNGGRKQKVIVVNQKKFRSILEDKFKKMKTSNPLDTKGQTVKSNSPQLSQILQDGGIILNNQSSHVLDSTHLFKQINQCQDNSLLVQQRQEDHMGNNDFRREFQHFIHKENDSDENNNLKREMDVSASPIKNNVIDLNESTQSAEILDNEEVMFIDSDSDQETVTKNKKSTHVPMPELGPPPYPAMWTCYRDLIMEKSCYGRLLITIQEMHMDVMKAILSDQQAADRLRKKICYAEALVRKQKEYIFMRHGNLDRDSDDETI